MGGSLVRSPPPPPLFKLVLPIQILRTCFNASLSWWLKGIFNKKSIILQFQMNIFGNGLLSDTNSSYFNKMLSLLLQAYTKDDAFSVSFKRNSCDLTSLELSPTQSRYQCWYERKTLYLRNMMRVNRSWMYIWNKERQYINKINPRKIR